MKMGTFLMSQFEPLKTMKSQKMLNDCLDNSDQFVFVAISQVSCSTGGYGCQARQLRPIPAPLTPIVSTVLY
jgi:hypothetical protein